MIFERQDPRNLGERLQLALAAGRLGSWQLTLPERRLEASRQCLANHGLPPDAPLSLSGVIEAIDLGEQQRFRDAIEGAISAMGSFEIEVPNRWPDGTAHWLLICGRAIDAGCMVGVTQDVTARHRLEEQLRDTDRRKDEFLATLGHELRNPLASIVTAVAILQVRGPDDPVLIKARDAILRQALQLARLVDDLLDVGRINQGKLGLEKKRAELNALLSQAVESCTPLIEKRGHRLEVVASPAPLLVEVDPARIVQVVSNLLNNAAKYMHDGGFIRLTASNAGNAAVISVRDEGVGIPPDMLGSIFQRFVQVESTRARADGGLGIGLSLAKALVEMHEGSIEAHSDGAGRGSEFVVRLPLAEAARSAVAAP